MNIIRTMQADEKRWWVDLLFDVGPHAERDDGEPVPAFPPSFPFPTRIRRAAVNDWFYLLYGGRLVGFGKIGKITHTPLSEVGTDLQEVGPGQTVTLDGPLRKMPYVISARGFTGVRYTAVALHEVGADAAGRAVAEALGTKAS